MKTPIDFIIEKMSRHDWAELPKSMKQEVISQAQELFENHIIEAYSSGYTDCSNEYRFNRDYYSTKYKTSDR
jgi:hypothetical protein